jgi:DNA (cytosine-5)-methyltransferase 1
MKFIDFFSGIGGFRLGMEMAGNECVGHCEIDKFADKSYRAMHDVKEGEWYANDIRAVEPGDLPEADCYCGGFPCQAFSVAGKRGGFEDTRGTLFFEVMRLAAVRKPEYLFMENVAGLLSHDGGKTFGTILNTLGQLGYWYEYQVLNSKNYGVPQNRERVFVIGHLGGYSGGEIFPIRQSNEVATREVDGLQNTRQIAGALRATDYKGTHNCIRELINKTHDSITLRDDFNCIDANYYKGLDSHRARTGVLEVRPVLTPDRSEKRQNGRRMKEPGEEMFTLTAQDKHGVMLRPVRTEYGKEIRKQYEAGEVEESRHNMTKLEPRNDDIANTLTSVQKDNLLLQQTRIRRLTPKECFRLQGFPDEYFNRAAAVNSDSQLYKQAGNSVTVNVIYEIARRLT